MATESELTPDAKVFRRVLEEHFLRLNNVQIGYEVWSQFLTEAERTIVGPFKEAYAFGGGRTVGMWARAKGIGLELATIELARLYGLPEGIYQAFLKQLDDQERTSVTWECQNKPYWSHEACELRWNGEVIRRIRNRSQAKDLIRILNAFEEDRWPNRIDNPIPGMRDRAKLGDRIKSLNHRLSQIKFRADGEGKGIIWYRRD